MTELTNAQLHQIREALRISAEYLPDNEDLTTVNAALDIVDRLLDVSTVVIESKEVPAAKVETAPVAKAKKAPKAKPELTAGQESALHTAFLNEKRGTWLERDIRRDVFDKLRERGFVDGYHSNWRLSEKALRYMYLDDDMRIAKHHVARLSSKIKNYAISVYDYRPGSFDRVEHVAENIDKLNAITIELTRWEIRAGIAK